MSNRSSTNIHARGLVVLAVAATALELLAASPARAASSAVRRFEATQAFEAVFLGGQRRGIAIEQPLMGARSCDDIDYGTGDRSCGSMTGGPSGGNSSRN